MSGRVLHFGKYEGCEVQRVVETDPEYILWAVDNVKGHGISQRAVADARANLDETDPYEVEWGSSHSQDIGEGW